MSALRRPADLTSRAVPRAGLLAGGLLAAAAVATWVGARARRAVREHPPTGRFVAVDGVRLHLLDVGSRRDPPVVLLHGNAVTLDDFVASGLVERLRSHHRVVAVDLPGFGHSERPRDRLWRADAKAGLLWRALDRIGVERPVVLGHSWGTLAALAMAMQRPHAVAGLVLVSGYYYAGPRLDVPVAALPAVPVLGDLMRWTTSPLLARALLGRTVAAMFAPMDPPPDYLRTVPRELLVRPSQLRAVAEDAAFLLPDAHRLSRGYSTLDVPVALVAGSDDLVVDPQAHSARLNDALPRATLEVVRGAGHMVHHAPGPRLLAAIDRLSTPLSLESTLRTFAAPLEPLADRPAEPARPPM